MRRGVFAIVFVAACGGQGVDIEVHPDTKQFDAVELWVSYGECKTPDGSACDGIGWPNAQLRPSGDVYTVGEYPSTEDPSGRVTDEKVVRTEQLVGGVAQLHLDIVPGSETPYAIAVVGFQGTKAVGAKLLSPVEIPTDGQAHWVVNLHDVGDVTGEVSKDPGDGYKYNALVWARESTQTLDTTGYTGCLAYQKWTGSGWETLYFVPKADPDCDGMPPDCNPYWYNASTSNARCVGPSTNPTFSDVCNVGNLSCKSETTEVSCTTQSTPLICVPSKLCDVCSDSQDLLTCLKSQVPMMSDVQASEVPMQICPMTGDADGPCTNSQTPLGWKASFFIKGGACTPNAMSQIVMLRPLFNPFTGGSNSMTMGTAIVTAHAGPITTPTIGCAIDISWTQGVPNTLGVQAMIAAVSYGPGREVLVPLLLDFQTPNGSPTCGTTPYPAQDCRTVGPWPEASDPGDTMFKCTM